MSSISFSSSDPINLEGLEQGQETEYLASARELIPLGICLNEEYRLRRELGRNLDLNLDLISRAYLCNNLAFILDSQSKYYLEPMKLAENGLEVSKDLQLDSSTTSSEINLNVHLYKAFNKDIKKLAENGLEILNSLQLDSSTLTLKNKLCVRLNVASNNLARIKQSSQICRSRESSESWIG